MHDELEDTGIAPDIQRRLLEFLNAARHPEDPTGLERADIPKELLPELLNARDAIGAYGFTHIRELLRIRGLRELFDRIIRLFGPSSFGEWTMPYTTELPDGTAYHVAHAALLRTAHVLFLPERNTKTTLHSVTGTRIRVVLEEVLIVDDREPSLKKAGEIDFEVLVRTDDNGGLEQRSRVPASGHVKLRSGERLAVGETVFEGFAVGDLGCT